MKIAWVGASGYGNVGDDTYPLVFAQQWPEHEWVIYNSDLPAALPEDLTLLVLGGGGILYNNPKEGQADAESPHFRAMKFYMDAAIARGIPWGILSCGFQFQVNREAEYAAVFPGAQNPDRGLGGDVADVLAEAGEGEGDGMGEHGMGDGIMMTGEAQGILSDGDGEIGL